MLLLIDNYDSFTYNLYQYLSELGQDVVVIRNDKTTIGEIEKMQPEFIVVSPGPGRPENAGISNDVIRHFAGVLPILGVCLGHQCVGQAFGATVERAGEIKHGKSSLVHHDSKGVLAGLPNPFSAIRYHSLAVMKDSLPDCFDISAQTKNGIIMGLRHKDYPIESVQFHPESIMTKEGKDLLKNFLGMGVTK